MQTVPSAPTRRSARFGRKYGPTFNGFDNMANVSLCSQEIGPIHIDCRFRHSKTQLGILGAAENRAGILYVDLTFTQPKGCRLTNAVVWISLEDTAEPERSKIMPRTKRTDLHKTKSESGNSGPADFRIVEPRANNSRFLQFTHDFGPRQLEGQPTEVTTKKRYHFTPEINVLGNGGGGLGYDREHEIKQTSCWMFTGNILPGSRFPANAQFDNGTRGMVYRTLKWELSEDDLQPQSTHSNVIQTAFTFEHDNDPFFIRVEIQGKLRRVSDRLKRKFLMFPSETKKKEGSSVVLVLPDKELEPKRRLDPIARGLPYQMERLNLESLRVQLPSSLPASFQELSEPLPGLNNLPRKTEVGNNDDHVSISYRARPTITQSESSERVPSLPPTRQLSHEAASKFEIPKSASESLEESSKKVPSTTSSKNPQTPIHRPLTQRENYQWSKEQCKAEAIHPETVLISPRFETLEEVSSQSHLDELKQHLFQYPVLLLVIQWTVYLMKLLPTNVRRKQLKQI